MSDKNTEDDVLDIDLRIFKEGSTKSHYYRSGDERSACGTQKLRRDSENLPKWDSEDPEDMCRICLSILDDLRNDRFAGVRFVDD